MANELFYTTFGVILGSVLTAIFSTENFKEIVNFKVGKVRCRLNNQAHYYKYYSEIPDPVNGQLSVYRCVFCGDMTAGKNNIIYEKKNNRFIKIKL